MSSFVKALSLLLIVLWTMPPAVAQEKEKKTKTASTLPKPTQANFKYGPHERNVFDFWQAKSDQPTPLVIYIHGGGFVGGDKNNLNARSLQQLLDAGISVAAINYRFVQHAPLPAAHEDCARALQTLRSKSAEWNINKNKVGGMGGSAGAQLVMYLAFHDDLADPRSDEPLKRESTRLQCVAPNGGQMTMDLAWWTKHIPGYSSTTNIRKMFGVETEEELLKKNAQIAALSLISKDDPPIFMSYAMAPDATVPSDAAAAHNWMVHHVNNGIELKKLCDQLGVESYLKYPGAKNKYASTTVFLIDKLKN